jgi:predicted NUDIX family phosphoesterase
MAEQVLVIPTEKFDAMASFQGLSPELAPFVPELLRQEHRQYLPRHEMEVDASYRQVIPYVVFRHRGDHSTPDLIFSYSRLQGGESRLLGKYSLGVGGHICVEDAAHGVPYASGLLREIEEEIEIPDKPSDSELCNSVIGVINDTRDAVGSVHLGIVHLVDLRSPEIVPKEDGMQRAQFRSLGRLQQLREEGLLEGWSELVLDYLLQTARPQPAAKVLGDAMLQLHNEVRVAAGAPILTYSQELSRTAAQHAQWMASRRRLTHNAGWFGIGGGLATRLNQAGVTATPVGENIHRGSEDLATVFYAWYGSTGHRQNMLNPRFTRMGLGVSGSYWCAQFTG